MIRVAIVDDDELIRESLKIILGVDKELDIVGTFKNGQDFLDFTKDNEVDVVLLDVRMPVLNGVDTTLEIGRRNIKTKVIILTTFEEDEFIIKAIGGGARGYMLKNTAPKQIIVAIKTVFSGATVIQEGIMDKFTGSLISQKSGEVNLDNFTERERDVIVEIANGLSNKEIGSKLFISEGTVKNYITSILNKLNLKHRTQIAIYYLTNKQA